MKKVKHYSPNLVYVLLIENKFYVGCHCHSKYLTEREVMTTSSNIYRRKKYNSIEEYLSNTKLLKVIECNSKEEALDLESNMIQEYKSKYGDDCLNICLYGNKHGSKGFHYTDKQLKHFSESHKGKKATDETKAKMSKSQKENKVCWKPIRDKVTGKIYPSIAECARENNFLTSNFHNGYLNPNSKFFRYEYVK